MGCLNCKHYTSDTSFKNGELIFERKCKLGHNELMNNWWEQAKGKTQNELMNLECFEVPETTILLDEMISLITQINEKL